jgi:hypothetical protein
VIVHEKASVDDALVVLNGEKNSRMAHAAVT